MNGTCVNPIGLDILFKPVLLLRPVDKKQITSQSTTVISQILHFASWTWETSLHLSPFRDWISLAFKSICNP